MEEQKVTVMHVAENATQPETTSNRENTFCTWNFQQTSCRDIVRCRRRIWTSTWMTQYQFLLPRLQVPSQKCPKLSSSSGTWAGWPSPKQWFSVGRKEGDVVKKRHVKGEEERRLRRRYPWNCCRTPLVLERESAWLLHLPVVTPWREATHVLCALKDNEGAHQADTNPLTSLSHPLGGSTRTWNGVRTSAWTTWVFTQPDWSIPAAIEPARPSLVEILQPAGDTKTSRSIHMRGSHGEQPRDKLCWVEINPERGVMRSKDGLRAAEDARR